MLRLALAVFAVQAGFHAFTASLPVALARAGVPDPQIGLIVGTAALVQIPRGVRDRRRHRPCRRHPRVHRGRHRLSRRLRDPACCRASSQVARSRRSSSRASSRASASRPSCRRRCRSFRGSSRAGRRGFGLAFVGSAHNLTLVVIPPISLAVLAATSLHGVALVGFASVLAGLAILRLVPLRFASSWRRTLAKADRPVSRDVVSGSPFVGPGDGLSRSTCCTSSIGASSSPSCRSGRRPPAPTSGCFFVADGIAILLVRVPTGWLADRVRPVFLILGGLGATACAVLLLTAPDNDALLVAAGALTGVGRRAGHHASSHRAVAAQPGGGSRQCLLIVLGRERDGAGHRKHRRGGRRGGAGVPDRDGRRVRGDRACRGR